jgi:hypothetical protein
MPGAHNTNPGDIGPGAAAGLTLRFLLEICALITAAAWGFSHDGWAAKLLLGLGAPAAIAVLWGAFVAPKPWVRVPGAAGTLLANIVEVVIWLFTLVALQLIGHAALAITFLVALLASKALIWGSAGAK